MSDPENENFNFEAAVRAFDNLSKIEQYSAYAHSYLAYLYSDPVYRNVDLTIVKSHALAWYESGYPQAAYFMGQLYARSGFADRNLTSAHAYYLEAAEAGYSYAYVEVASNFYFGSGVGKSVANSIPWFEKAAAAGDGYANYMLGKMYYTGSGRAKNAGRAERYILAAIELGNEDAQRLYDGGLRELLSELRAMPSGDAQDCMSTKRSSFDQNTIELHNTCNEKINVLICSNYATSDVIGFFSGEDKTSCERKTITRPGFLDSMYFAEEGAPLGWQMISGSRLQWWACYAPLAPTVNGTRVRCEW